MNLSFYRMLNLAPAYSIAIMQGLIRQTPDDQLSFATNFVAATEFQLTAIDKLPENQCTEWGNLVRACLRKIYEIKVALEAKRIFAPEVFAAMGFLEAVTKHFAPQLL